MAVIEWALARTFLFLFRFWNNVSVAGIENIPRDRRFIAASNHVSYLDPVVLLSILHGRNPTAPIATRGLFVFPLTIALNAAHAIRVDRGSLKQSGFVKNALETLEERPLLIFPEGGVNRYVEGKRVPGGVAYIALKTGLPVIPIRIEGTEKALPPGSFMLRRDRISVRIGEPIALKDQGRPNSELAAEVMSRIYSLKLRGYGRHGRHVFRTHI
jgi:1-acyl-sn-glycerol-3-phosphate acyltransferase